MINTLTGAADGVLKSLSRTRGLVFHGLRASSARVATCCAIFAFTVCVTPEWFYDSPPPKPAFFCFLFLTNVSWLLDTRKDTIENKVCIYVIVCEGLSIDAVGEGVEGCRETHTVFQEIGPVGGAGFETWDFVKDKLGGATVGRRPNEIVCEAPAKYSLRSVVQNVWATRATRATRLKSGVKWGLYLITVIVSATH